jgi:hypothetical protein
MIKKGLFSLKNYSLPALVLSESKWFFFKNSSQGDWLSLLVVADEEVGRTSSDVVNTCDYARLNSLEIK